MAPSSSSSPPSCASTSEAFQKRVAIYQASKSSLETTPLPLLSISPITPFTSAPSPSGRRNLLNILEISLASSTPLPSSSSALKVAPISASSRFSHAEYQGENSAKEILPSLSLSILASTSSMVAALGVHPMVVNKADNSSRSINPDRFASNSMKVALQFPLTCETACTPIVSVTSPFCVSRVRTPARKVDGFSKPPPPLQSSSFSSSRTTSVPKNPSTHLRRSSLLRISVT
mmetsp:Transcript_26420/g.59827  ORF Transcript_26420/g.59827 Transcript_26420/m.59827 type:complete len:232 (+) Transcript_26420:848-1543(+)